MVWQPAVSYTHLMLLNLSDGQKRSISYRARQLIADGAIDSNKTIATLEKCLGVDLVER